MLDPLLDDDIAFAELLRYSSQSHLARTARRSNPARSSTNGRALAGVRLNEKPAIFEIDRASSPSPSTYFELEQLEPSRPLARREVRPPRTLDDFAAPIAPLRERDLQAMADFFDTEFMLEIEADVTQHLLLLWPEPCWDEDPFDFLHEYI
jgi:hypothetical protein